MSNDEKIRELAVTLVDGLKEYTAEFAPDYAQHVNLYNVFESAIKKALQLNSAKIVPIGEDLYDSKEN